MESIVYLIIFIIVLVIIAKQGWLQLGAKSADVLQSKLERKIVEVEEADEYQHLRNLGKVADKWANNSKPIADRKMVKEAKAEALKSMYGDK